MTYLCEIQLVWALVTRIKHWDLRHTAHLSHNIQGPSEDDGGENDGGDDEGGGGEGNITVILRG